MQIRKLWFEKLGGLKNFQLIFPSPSEYHFGKMKLSILVGENGTGKTSILKFLSRIFVDEKYSKLLKTSFSLNFEVNDVENTLSDYNNDIFYMPEKVIVSSYSAFEPYKPSLYSNNSKSEYIYLGTLGKGPIGPVASLSSVCIPILETFFHPDRRKFKAINELLNEIGYVEFPMIQIGFVQASNYINKNYDGLKKGNINDNQIEEVRYLLDKLHYFHRDVLNIKRTNGRYLIDPYMLEKYIDGPHGWLADVKRLANIPGGINLIRSLSFQKGEDLIPLNELSSGELSMFFRFFKLIAAIGDNSIVLIDEPETHLHPRWIQKYLNMIKSIFNGYDTHFIIATHSPLIAADVPNESIIGLRKNEKGQVEQYTVNEQTLGTSPQEILREVFKLDNHFGDFTNNTISNIHKLIDDGKIDLARKLYDDLGDSDEKFTLFLRMKQQLDKGN